jgi:hypothetical protein
MAVNAHSSAQNVSVRRGETPGARRTSLTTGQEQRGEDVMRQRRAATRRIERAVHRRPAEIPLRQIASGLQVAKPDGDQNEIHAHGDQATASFGAAIPRFTTARATTKAVASCAMFKMAK